ncbi:MAG: hypothetical protein V1776_02945 [Candidatus Diapherotrites archaeon]
MGSNTALVLGFAWIVGVMAARLGSVPAVDIPALMVIIGFIIAGFFSGWLFFGRLTPLLIMGIGFWQSGWVHAFPVAGLLLGVCTIAAGIYGKTLGDLTLVDIYSNAQTRLPGLMVAAFLNLGFIVLCSIVVWYLFGILPNAEQMEKWLPFAGLGV